MLDFIARAHSVLLEVVALGSTKLRAPPPVTSASAAPAPRARTIRSTSALARAEAVLRRRRAPARSVTCPCNSCTTERAHVEVQMRQSHERLNEFGGHQFKLGVVLRLRAPVPADPGVRAVMLLRLPRNRAGDAPRRAAQRTLSAVGASPSFTA